MSLEISRRAIVAGTVSTSLLAMISASRKGTRPLESAREFIWRRIMDEQSFEHGRIKKTEDGVHLSGTVLIAEQEAPLRAEYYVHCDAAWRTRSVTVTQHWRGRTACLQLHHDGGGNWMLNGTSAPDLDGCTDVDLGISPSTNALPVNRLGLNVGDSRMIQAAWVRFPRLEAVPAEQRYERLQDDTYRYRSIASGFEALIRVDGDGLPVDYDGIWKRIAEDVATPDEWEASPGNESFTAALLSAGPSSDLGTVAEDFDWLVGGWSGEVRDIDDDGRVRTAMGEWWFAWVLDGRAMQDVWIVPCRADRPRASDSGIADDRYGSTIRWFDRRSGLWQIAWFNPVSGTDTRLTGRREGNRITLTGEDGGKQIRWRFNDISPDSFLWTGETRSPEGSWKKEAEFRLRRMRQDS